MKKTLLLALVLIVSACSKSDDTSSEDSSTIFGEWELYSIAEDGYDELEGEEKFPTIEFISPDAFRQLWYDNDDDTVTDIIGTFTLTGDILTLTETFLNGESVSRSPDLYVDVEISKNTMTWGERYDDGYVSGYATYHFRRIN